MFRIRIEDDFDASHTIPGHPGKCRNLHGHTYRVEVFVVGKSLDKNGILEGADFIELKNALHNIINLYDHTHLNDIMGDSTSAENIARRVFQDLQGLGVVGLEKVRVWESARNYAEYWDEINAQ
jgi:6-pyruvoyltetrahydropterin/6-carboxytetrahydropterin synthase